VNLSTPPETRLLSAAALGKLRWRCRRGLLENDLLIERFFNRYEAGLTEAQAAGLEALMDLSDPDLLDLLLARREPEGALDGDPCVRPVLDQLRGRPAT
jgi:antitoxin CptB